MRPKIDEDLEAEVKKCHTCQSARRNLHSAPFIPGSGQNIPGLVYISTMLDPLLRKMFLVAIDAHSKWLEVHMMSITDLRVVVSDNATVFSAVCRIEVVFHYDRSTN